MRPLGAALALLLSTTLALAQLTMTNVGGGGASGATPFSGPGDVVASAIQWGGVRAYSAAAAAAQLAAINVRNTVTNENCDIKVATTGGLASTVASCSGVSSGITVALFCTGGCAVPKIYDQTGNGHTFAQVTAGNQPTFTLSCLNGGTLPCITFVSASSTTMSSSFGPTSQPVSFAGVAERTGNFTTTSDIAVTNSGGPVGYAFLNAANTFDAYGGLDLTATASDSVLHAFQAVLFGITTSYAVVDGTSTPGNAGNNSLNNTMFIGSYNATQNFLQGNIEETGIWPVQFSPAQQASMHVNMSAYWGTP